jgi:phosphate starvation-inducible protein PhoH and related proteins
MNEAVISIANHDKIHSLFGAQDEHIRLVQDLVGIDIVFRGNELRLQGDENKIKRGTKIIEELLAIVEKTGKLKKSQVTSVINGGDSHEKFIPRTKIQLLDQDQVTRPRTEGQQNYIRMMEKNDLVFCGGPAGSGKTYLAVAMAIQALRKEEVRKIVLVRPAVEAGEKLGFLPGDIVAKVNPYLRPLLDALNEMLDFETVKRYMESDVIEIVPLAFMRGRTLSNTFIILDEGQNTTVTQMKMFLTRMGENSKIVVTGDTTQQDIPDNVKSGMIDAMARLSNVNRIGIVKLTGLDIVRHRLVKAVVEAYEKDDIQNHVEGKNTTQ